MEALANYNGTVVVTDPNNGRILTIVNQKLAFKGGTKLDQIQLSLGHAAIQTTERYLGVQQDLTDAPCDYPHLKVE